MGDNQVPWAEYAVLLEESSRFDVLLLSPSPAHIYTVTSGPNHTIADLKLVKNHEQ